MVLKNILQMKTYIRTNFQNCKALAIIVGNIKRYQAINVAKQFFRKESK